MSIKVPLTEEQLERLYEIVDFYYDCSWDAFRDCPPEPGSEEELHPEHEAVKELLDILATWHGTDYVEKEE